MKNSLYYSEIAAKISAHLYQNPDHITQIGHSLDKEHDEGETIWSICADAARVFDAIEDLSEDHFVDWHKALNHYADKVLYHLLQGRKPHIIDMVSMAARSIENTLLHTQKQG